MVSMTGDVRLSNANLYQTSRQRAASATEQTRDPAGSGGASCRHESAAALRILAAVSSESSSPGPGPRRRAGGGGGGLEPVSSAHVEEIGGRKAAARAFRKRPRSGI